MGNKESVTSVSLNYSAILYSPFEFYAMEDWRNMQKLGIIFEENLRRHKYDPDFFLGKTNESKQKKEEYIRKDYKWTISSLDKHLKRGRYSPLYLDWNNKEQSQRQRILPGYDRQFLNYENFKEQWDKRWEQLIKRQDQKITSNKIKKQDKKLVQTCTLFDYLAYRSIIEFLFTQTPRYREFQFSDRSTKHKDYRFSKLLQEINSQQQTIFKDEKNKEGMKNAYFNFLNNSFKRIDDYRKQQITRKHLLLNPLIDIVNFQQANKNICGILKRSQEFYLYGNLQDVSEDQCLTLVRKKLPFIPQGYDQIYRLQKESLTTLRENLRAIQSSKQDIKIYWNRLKGILEPVFRKKIIDKLQSVAFKQNVHIVDLNYQAMGYISNPCKIILDKWLQKYQKFFYDEHVNARGEKEKQQKQFLQEIQARGLLCWSQAFTLITFQPKNSDQLGQYLLGNFHLTSKTGKNKLQVQILGLLIHELIKHNIKFIIAGDFNSHIMVKSKDEKASMFNTLDEYLQKQEKENIKKSQLDREQVNIYPKHKNILTTKKKRTIMQVQVNKSNELAEKCIDQIITNLTIDESHCYTGEITDIGSSSNKNKNFLPNANHPYDHFLVQANIKLHP